MQDILCCGKTGIGGMDIETFAVIIMLICLISIDGEQRENADQFKSYSDFEGKTIGAQTATTKYNIISEIPDVSPVALQNVLDLIKEVSYGKVDAILVDGSVAQQYQASNDDLVALSFDELGTSADVCVAVAKGDPKGLLPKINEAIAKMNEENKIEEFKKTANDYADVWQEVSAPEEDTESEEE